MIKPLTLSILALLTVPCVIHAQSTAAKTAYTRMIKKADSLYYTGNCNAALDSFKVAAVLVKKEFYAKNRITEIETCLKRSDTLMETCFCRSGMLHLSIDDQKIKEYVVLWSNIDSAVQLKNDSLVNAYFRQIDMMRTREYVYQKSRAYELESRYKQCIAQGDKAFANKDYHVSRENYSRALAYKPGEQYPAAQLAKLNKMISEQAKAMALEKEGNDAFAAKKYDVALEKYNQSIELVPDNSRVQDKIKEIKTLLGGK